jgi:superfamily I DNA and RNA helicase
MAVTTRGATPEKPVSSQRLAALFESNLALDGYLYVGYPIGTAEGPYVFDGIWLSPTKGIVLINLIEGREAPNFQEIQDDCYNKLESKLKGHRTLMDGRKQKFEIRTVTFAPASPAQTSDEAHPFLNTEESFLSWLMEIEDWAFPESFSDVVEAIQSIGSIRKNKSKREVKKPDSRGAKLKRLEDSISNLDSQQTRAVIETVEGVQRVRGLAGSGKTIVLALKAAYLHAIHPDWKIAVTFHTRSLKGQFRRLINTFVVDKTGLEPVWENLHIIHA